MTFFQIPKWDKLKNIGLSPTFRTSYFWFAFVPLASKVAHQISMPQLQEWIGVKKLTEIDLPFSWYLFFFAAVFFSVGNLLFSWRCPKIIKDYDNFMDFYQKGGGAFYLWREANAIDRDWKVVQNPVSVVDVSCVAHLVMTSEFAHGRIPDQQKMFEGMTMSEARNRIHSVPRENQNDLFFFLADCWNDSSWNARTIVSSLYAIGFILLAVVAIQSICYVTLQVSVELSQ